MMMKKLRAHESLPSECKQFKHIIGDLRRRNSDKSNHAKAFEGLSAHEAEAAMAARVAGRLSHAQIQRRLTRSSSGRWR